MNRAQQIRDRLREINEMLGDNPRVPSSTHPRFIDWLFEGDPMSDRQRFALIEERRRLMHEYNLLPSSAKVELE